MLSVRRLSILALGCALALAAAPGSAAQPWTEPQTVTATPGPNPATAAAATADGTVVAINHDATGDFRRSTRAPGGDWVPDGSFAEPDGATVKYVHALAVTSDGAGWLVYTVDGSEDVRVARWAPDGSSEVIGGIVDPWTIVELTVDAENDVLLTYGQRGGYPLSAIHGDAVDGLQSLDVPSWTGGQRPHQWSLGPGDEVMLASRFGSRLRTVDVGPGSDGRTRRVDERGGGFTGQVAAAIAPSGMQYVAWTTAPQGKARTVRVARRAPDGGWLPARTVDRQGPRSRPQQSLELRATGAGAFLAWVQPGKGGSQVRGALVRRQRPVLEQVVAGKRVAGDLGRHPIAVDVDRRGRLLVAWTRADEDGRQVAAALGRVRGKPATARLFDVVGINVPVALLRRAGEATVVGGSASSADGGSRVVRSVSTD